MPSVFVSHGAPTLMIEDSPTRTFLAGLGKILARPRAVLCVSAHWETAHPILTGVAQPQTIHDFYGFPPALYEMRYPAPGDPELAREAAALLTDAGFEVEIDGSRGLDHGA
ncbi:MAG: dioxygenase, partial [Acidiferrobacterales bacterium]